jgi:hypothetical protein
MKDPDFIEEAQRSDMEVRPESGEAVQQLVSEIYASPPEVVALAAKSIQDAK